MEDVFTKRVMEGVLAHAVSALRPALRPMERARGREVMPPTGAAMWMKPEQPGDVSGGMG